MKIVDFEIGAKTFIIAELSANHGGDIDVAKKTILAAKEAGADAIKLQTYTADTLTIDCKKDCFKLSSGTIWDGVYLYDLYREAYTPWEWHKELFDYARSLDLIIFSSPFDKTAVDFLEELNTPAYKVASFELVDIPLIEYIASKGKPVIMSTGIADISDIKNAVEACRGVGNNDIILLKCTSAYPAKVEDANLLTIPDMKESFGVEVGLSDHSLGSTVPVVSVALGAKVIEKHFILDKGIKSADAGFSLDKKEFSDMVKAVRDAESALGKVDYDMTEKKKRNRKFARSLFIVKDVKEGEVLSDKNVRSIRPSDGLAPRHLNEVLGKRVKSDFTRGTPLKWDMIE